MPTKPQIVILTGTCGAGKTTVARELALLLPKVAVVDVDQIRYLLKPYKSPWEGRQGEAQLRLGWKNSADLARNFHEDGADVIFLDILTEAANRYYRRRFQRNFKAVLLAPDLEECVRRNALPDREKVPGWRIKELYEELKNGDYFDLVIDNTDISPSEVASQIKRSVLT